MSKKPRLHLVQSCDVCPFAWNGYCAETNVAGGGREIPADVETRPRWCPLNRGPIVVAAEKRS